MIRLFRGICKAFHKINLDNDLNSFNTYISSIDVERLSCPYCKGKGRLTYFASYKRHLITYENGKVVDHIVEIPRYICPSCDHPHAILPSAILPSAILPSAIVPHRSFAFGFLVSLIYDYLTGTFSSVEMLCKHYEISISTFYRILDNFKEQKKLWLGLLGDKIIDDLDFIQNLRSAPFTIIEEFIKGFFMRRGVSFFQETS